MCKIIFRQEWETNLSMAKIPSLVHVASCILQTLNKHPRSPQDWNKTWQIGENPNRRTGHTWRKKSPSVSPALDRSLRRTPPRRLVWDQRRRVRKALPRAELSLRRRTPENKFIPIVISQTSGYCCSFKYHCSTFISTGNMVGIMFPTLHTLKRLTPWNEGKRNKPPLSSQFLVFSTLLFFLL